MTTAVVLLSKNAARALTKRIQDAGADFSAMLLEAHDGEAWRVLGYQSWSAYVEGAFTFTRGRSYALLDQGRIARAVGSPVTDAEARSVRRAVHPTPLAEAPSAALQAALEEQRASAAISKPSTRGHPVRGLEGLVAATRRLDEQYATIADERSAEDALPPDLVRVAEHFSGTLGRLLR